MVPFHLYNQECPIFLSQIWQLLFGYRYILLTKINKERSVPTHTNIHVCVYTYIYIYRERERERDTHTQNVSVKWISFPNQITFIQIISDLCRNNQRLFFMFYDFSFQLHEFLSLEKKKSLNIKNRILKCF